MNRKEEDEMVILAILKRIFRWFCILRFRKMEERTAISAVFNNHWLAVDACGELGGIGLIVNPGYDRKKGRGKKQTQLVIDLPQDNKGQVRKLIATTQAIVEKYEGNIVL